MSDQSFRKVRRGGEAFARPIVATIMAAWALMSCSTNEIVSPLIPSRPANLTASLVPPNTVQLTWTAAVADSVSRYNVYRNGVLLSSTTKAEYLDTGLVSNTTYEWFVVAKSPGGGLSAPSDPARISLFDVDAPKVVNATPANGGAGVSRLPVPTVTFSEPMIPSSVNPLTFVATVTATGAIIPGTVAYNVESRTADFWPISIFPARTSITITITKGASDVAGNGAVPFSFAFTTGDTPTLSDLPAHNSTIVFTARNFSNTSRDLFTMRADGTDKKNLTDNVGDEADPSWSPDGRHIAFATDKSGNNDIYIMREDGTGIRQLTSSLAEETQPRWSSDGTRLVFRSSKEGVVPSFGFQKTTDIFAMNVDGTGQVNLTKSPEAWDDWPQWSPDGKRLIYTRTAYETRNSPNIFVANADGTGAMPLRAPDSRWRDDVASWSPDGRQIAFSAFDKVCCLFRENYVTFVIDPDGSNLRQVKPGGDQRWPAWSPDGSSLVYSTSGRTGEWWSYGEEIEIRKLDVTTGLEVALTPVRGGWEIQSPQAWRR